MYDLQENETEDAAGVQHYWNAIKDLSNVHLTIASYQSWYDNKGMHPPKASREYGKCIPFLPDEAKETIYGATFFFDDYADLVSEKKGVAQIRNVATGDFVDIMTGDFEPIPYADIYAGPGTTSTAGEFEVGMFKEALGMSLADFRLSDG